ncbi:VOC family protein [Ohtaekwangia kribbensis]|jgi:catechol 2,3-dioxygenase-like lactoylglutathione lyase family enzyme|uniref:VOC family protein n=1 Tax=Ohtaekwangia kribbensis TaxID=688913 RepID=A0ABW3K6U1_9BACT
MTIKGIVTVFIHLSAGFAAWSQLLCEEANLHKLIIGIDHVPIVVRDLNEAKTLFSDHLKFTVKNGREHEGISNFFVKFQDGTYLEFITPLDSSFAIGNYYSNFLKHRAGGTSLALSVKSADSVMLSLQQCAVPFKSNENPVWLSVEPSGYDLFYIEYRNKTWKEREVYTTHANQSLSLKSVWWISEDPAKYISNFTKLGFVHTGASTYLGIRAQVLKAGSSELIVVSRRDGASILANFKSAAREGVFGFTVQVKSLATIKQLLKDQNLVIKGNSIIYYVRDYNFFIVFTE